MGCLGDKSAEIPYISMVFMGTARSVAGSDRYPV